MKPYRILMIALFILTLPAPAKAESFFDFFRFNTKDAKTNVNPDNSGRVF